MTAPVEVRNRVLNARLNQNGKSPLELHNSVILNTTGTPGYAINPQTKSWSLNLQCKDTTLNPPSAYVMSETDCTGLAGKTVIAAARCSGLTSNLYQSRTLVLAAFDQSNNPLGTGNYGIVNGDSSQLITLEWTVPTNTTRLEYRMYTTIDGSSGVWWAQPLLCTKAEWQALQGVGETYFNGDKLPE